MVAARWFAACSDPPAPIQTHRAHADSGRLQSRNGCANSLVCPGLAVEGTHKRIAGLDLDAQRAQGHARRACQSGSCPNWLRKAWMPSRVCGVRLRGRGGGARD